RERPGAVVAADVAVAIGPPASNPTAPLRVKSFAFERTLPEVKHVGTFPLFHHRRLVQDAGYDDAVFVDRNGCIAEGSVWNIGFVEGNGVVWPLAPQLRGISLQLLQAGLKRRGIESVVRAVELADVGRYRAAFFTDSS